MKIVIFAGGVGTRLWPLSRKNNPKQFEKIFGDRSTLQETIHRLRPDFAPADIYIATGKRYEEMVRRHLSEIPAENFIFEPEMRDVGPAIGLAAAMLAKQFPDEPIAILWSDHLVKNKEAFRHALHQAEEMITNDHAKFVFIAQKARFANQNMGWIELGEEVKQNEKAGANIYAFKKLHYRPTLEEAERFLKDSHFVWNLGYFVTTPRFLASLFEQFVPDMYRKLEEISRTQGTSEFEPTLERVYPTLEKISFDDAVLVKLVRDDMFVLAADLEWSDIGAWEALKEALSDSEDDNVIKGNVMLEDTRDTLVFNYGDQLLVGIDLDQLLVVNTEDVLLVCPKTSVPKIKKLVEKLRGTSLEHLT